MKKMTRSGARPDTEEDRIHQQLVYLTLLLPPGSSVYTLTSRATNNYSMRVAVLVINKQGEIQNISKMVCDVLGRRWDDAYNGVMVPNIENIFDLVHALSFKLHGTLDRGEDAAIAATKGLPFPPTNAQYRAGFSLIHRKL